MTSDAPRNLDAPPEGASTPRPAGNAPLGGEAAAGVRFRRATNRDAVVAARVVDGALREYGMRVSLDACDVELTDLERHYDARGGAYEIVEGPNGELLGVLGVLGGRPTPGGVYELKKHYLVREARGASAGSPCRAPGPTSGPGGARRLPRSAGISERRRRRHSAAGPALWHRQTMSL